MRDGLSNPVRAVSRARVPPPIPAPAGNRSCFTQSRAARIAGLRTAPLPAQSSPASQQSGDGGLPGKKIALDLQLADLAVQIVNYPLPILDAGALLPPANSSPARGTSSCFPLLVIRRLTPNFPRKPARVF